MQNYQDYKLLQNYLGFTSAKSFRDILSDGLFQLARGERSKCRSISRAVSYLATGGRANSSNPPVVIGGWGRCGTTVLFNCLKKSGSLIHRPFLVAITPDLLISGYRYKTHAFPPEYLPQGAKIIWMFGHPGNAITSSYRAFKGAHHFHSIHTNTPFFHDPTEMFRRDVFCLNAHLEAWHKNQPFDLLCVKYESIGSHETQVAIQQFLGFEIEFPVIRARSSNWMDSPFVKEIKQSYASLIEAHKNLPDYTLYSARSGASDSSP